MDKIHKVCKTVSPSPDSTVGPGRQIFLAQRLQHHPAVTERLIGVHVGPEVDVLLLVLDGTGPITTELTTLDLHPGALVWLPQRFRPQFTAGPHGLSYLTVHPRRQPCVSVPPGEQ